LFFSKFDFFLVLRNNTAATAKTCQAVASDVSSLRIHVICLPYSRVLDGCQNAINSTQHSESYARTIDGGVAQHICGIFLFSSKC
jgi:hypothetical protein